MAYIMTDSATVTDSTAQIRLPVATLAYGSRVEVLERRPDWARVRVPNGRTGWVELSNLIDSESYERGQDLLKAVESGQRQAVGHTAGLANLRVGASRDAAQLAQLSANQGVEIFDRRLADRPSGLGAPPPSGTDRDVWYLVRAHTKAGWVYGPLISLDIPEAISHYAQGRNLVAWLTLDTVDDNGREVPQYVTADRMRKTVPDFTNIRVFTWGKERQRYATAYVESRLTGFFPIRVSKVEGVPHFRLRLEDRTGRKFQKVYRLDDTIVRPIGTVEGWESDAIPGGR